MQYYFINCCSIRVLYATRLDIHMYIFYMLLLFDWTTSNRIWSIKFIILL